MKTAHIKRIIGLLLLSVFLSYFGYKLFTSVDSMLAMLILAMVVFVTLLVWYVVSR